MAIRTANQRLALANAYAAEVTHGAVYNTVPTGATQGTEFTTRVAVSWGTASDDGTNATISGTATFDIPAGETVRGSGLHTAVSAGEYRDGNSVTEQAYASAGTYAATFTYTQS